METTGRAARRPDDRRRRLDRRTASRGLRDRRQGDRRAAVLIGMVLLVAAPAGARADVFTRQSPTGVLEATNVPSGGPGFTLAYRSKGLLIHSPGFRPASATSLRLEPLIQAAAAREGLDPDLVRAVIHVESAFDERATSSAGACGVMQLMPDTARRFGVRDAFDAEQNIAGGTRYLALLLRRFNSDVSLALAAYNAGEGAVTRYGGIPPFRETLDYVRRVIGLHAAGGRAQEPSAGMVTFTPGSPPRVSVAITSNGAAVRRSARVQLFRWTDGSGIVHVGEAPPAGVPYRAIRDSGEMGR